jgi:hypothetical protein
MWFKEDLPSSKQESIRYQKTHGLAVLFVYHFGGREFVCKSGFHIPIQCPKGMESQLLVNYGMLNLGLITNPILEQQQSMYGLCLSQKCP